MKTSFYPALLTIVARSFEAMRFTQSINSLLMR